MSSVLDLPKELQQLAASTREVREAADLFLTPRGVLPQHPLYAAELSAWFAHAFVRRAASRQDFRWKFGCIIAAAHNRAWREALRAERACPHPDPPVYPANIGQAYYRLVHTQDPACRHFVAFCDDEATEIVDLAFWLWTDADKGVSGPPAVWIHAGEDGQFAAPPLDGASWDSFNVYACPAADLTSWKCTTREAAATLDALLGT